MRSSPDTIPAPPPVDCLEPWPVECEECSDFTRLRSMRPVQDGKGEWHHPSCRNVKAVLK